MGTTPLQNCLPLGPRFSGAARKKSDIQAIAEASIIEARQKEQRLLSFYEDPYGDGSEPWHLERILWKYEREFKTVGTKRKDGATESIIHELDPALMSMTLLRAGFLSDRVTYQIIKGAKRLLPSEQHPIGNLFCTFPIHDRDEDDPDASRDTLIEYANDHISALSGINNPEKDFLRKRTLFIADVSDAITFGRKVRNPDGRVTKEITHGEDLSLYIKAMRDLWPAMSAKGLDRLGGLITRFSRVPAKGMKPHKNMNYLDETRRLFMAGQPLEDMAERYPQLSPYFDIVNANLRIALVCMDAMVQHHPNLNKKHFKNRGVLNPETTEISIHRHLPMAMRAAPWTSPDICPITCLLEGMVAEADRHPSLKPIVEQVQHQANYFLTTLGSAFKRDNINPKHTA